MSRRLGKLVRNCMANRARRGSRIPGHRFSAPYEEMPMSSTLFITGATSGFGDACARRFAEA
ncbi:hypothetical protein ACV34L_33035, partial [Pseudomonas aeruginosa]